MTLSPKTQAIPAMLSGSIGTYRRNFGKLFFIFLLSIALLAIPLFIFLQGYVNELNQIIQGVDDALAFYMIAYLVRPMLLPVGIMIAIICGIGVFTSPLFMGIAGKIVSEDMKGKKCSLKEAFAWTRQNYKKLLSAYAVYYGVYILYGFLSSAVLVWMSYYSSHLISDVWLNPTMVLLAAGWIAILLGTVFVPFGVIEQGKSGFHAFGHSMRTMYSRRFLSSFAALAAGAVIAAAFSFLVQLPYTYNFLIANPGYSRFDNFIKFALNTQNDVILIILAVVVNSIAGVFLFIFAYNTYRNANNNTNRIENNAQATGRRRLK